MRTILFKRIFIWGNVILPLALLITCSFIGCSKNKDGAIKVYGYADVNGVAYKDYVAMDDAFQPDLPLKPTLFNGDRLGVYNDSIFVFQFVFRNVQNQEPLWLFGAFLIPKGEFFPSLNKSYQLSKNSEYDKDRTTSEDFLKYLKAFSNNTEKGIAIVTDYEGGLSTIISIDGTIVFNKFDNRTKKLDGDIYLNSNGKLPIPYKLEGHFSDVLSYNKVQL